MGVFEPFFLVGKHILVVMIDVVSSGGHAWTLIDDFDE